MYENDMEIGEILGRVMAKLENELDILRKRREDRYCFSEEDKAQESDRAALVAEAAYATFRRYDDIPPDLMSEYDEGKRDAWAQAFELLCRPDDPRLVEVLSCLD